MQIVGFPMGQLTFRCDIAEVLFGCIFFIVVKPLALKTKGSKQSFQVRFCLHMTLASVGQEVQHFLTIHADVYLDGEVKTHLDLAELHIDCYIVTLEKEQLSRLRQTKIS